MKNITVSIDDEAHRQARIWCAERGISLSKIVAYLLEHLPSYPAANRRFPLPNQSPAPSGEAPQLAAPPAVCSPSVPRL